MKESLFHLAPSVLAVHLSRRDLFTILLGLSAIALSCSNSKEKFDSPDVLKIPSPILFQNAERVETINEGVRELVIRMRNIMRNINAESGLQVAGLAAPQLGFSLRIFLMQSFSASRITEYINPRILWASEQQSINLNEGAKEACLSIPGLEIILKRPKSVRISYQTLTGDTEERQFDGLPARIVQHEIDHLNGILITQRETQQD